jgi:hypothetical protein
MRRLVILALALTAADGRALSAQRPIQLSVGGGVSMPMADLKDVAETRWHALGSLQVNSVLVPLGLRVDAAWTSFGGLSAGPGAGADLSVMSLTGNFTYRWPMTNSVLSPFIIAGMGAYRTSCDPDCDSETDFGWNAGLGTKLYLLGFRSFVEVRYHSASGGVRFIPVTFGITF